MKFHEVAIALVCFFSGITIGFELRTTPHDGYVYSLKQEVKECHAALNALVLKEVEDDQG